MKQHHPDANGGDRSTEDRLIEIIKAYNYLKTVVPRGLGYAFREGQFANQSFRPPLPGNGSAQGPDDAVDRADSKTLRVGASLTRGPPLSDQCSTRGSAPLVSQLISSLPEGLDSAPYLAALVASSCSATAIDWASVGGRRTSSPAILIRSPSRLAYGRSSSSTMVFKIRAGPTRSREQPLHVGKRAEPARKHGLELFRGIRLRQPQHRLSHREQVVGTVIDLGGEEQHPLLCLLASRDVDQHVHRTNQTPPFVAQRRRIWHEADAGSRPAARPRPRRRALAGSA